MYTTRDIHDVAGALVREIQEHGSPNTFTPGWLERFHRTPSPMVIGRIARECNVMLPDLVRARLPGITVTYADRRFHVAGSLTP